MPDQKKCAHPSCNCQVGKDAKYCSEYCEKAGSMTELRCGCHHANCA
jgi:hypothetical protein